MKKALALFLFFLFSAAAATEERAYYQKGEVTLVLIQYQDCCDYSTALKNWVPHPTPPRSSGYTCFINLISETDVSGTLACYRGKEKGRIGTRVIDFEEGTPCQTKTVGLLATGIDNIVQDFRKNGYPDGCGANGCDGGSGGISSD